MAGQEVHMRVWRGDANGGEFKDYRLTAGEGMVVLDIIHDVVNQRVSLFLGQGGVIQFLEITVNTNHRGLARTQMTIRSTLFNAKRQKLSNIHRQLSSYSHLNRLKHFY